MVVWAAGVAAVEQAGGGEAAQAGDQAVAVGLGGLGKGPDLNGLAQAVAVDGGGEVFEGCGVEVGAVAEQGVFEDFGGGDVGDHGASCSGQGAGGWLRLGLRWRVCRMWGWSCR